MRRPSVADDLAAEHRARISAMSSDERLALAFQLGDDDVALFCAAHGVDRETAIRAFRRQRQVGRQPSKCMEIEP